MPVAWLRWSAKTKQRHNKGSDDRDCPDHVVVQATSEASATTEASRSTELVRASAASSAMHETLGPTLTQSDALTEAISTVEQAGPSRQSSEYLSQAMMETMEEAARKASKRLSRPDRERVDKYLQRLRLLQELSRDFARYDVQCRIPLRRALNELTAIAFCGGGVLGTAYVGALSVLEQHGLDYARIKRFAGTSAGAIMASTLAVGYHAAGCMKQLQKLNFEDLMTPDLSALTRGRGLSSGKYLEQWMGQVLAERTGDSNITMAQVLERYGKELVIVTTELDTGRERKLTPYTDPDLPVKSAVRMSAGIPVVFDVYHYQGHQYCDGGLVNNWPVDALPQDGTGLGLVTFSFNDFIHYELYHLLWGPIPPETRGFDYERMGHAFAQALYSHSEKATTIFGVATRSMRIIYDRLTREQIYRYAERWPGGLSMPRAAFLCVGEYGALDTDISTTGQLELFEMGRLSMYVEVQRFMHELEYANTHSGSSIRDMLPISGDLYRQRLREASALNEGSPPGPDTHQRASTIDPGTDSVTTNARQMHQRTDQHPCGDDANADAASAAPENEVMRPVHSESSTSSNAELSAPSHTHVHFTEPANQESDLSPERQTSRSSRDAIEGPRRLWQAPEELFWRHIFLLSLREGRKLGPQVHARLFPSRLRRSARMGGLRAEAVLIQQDITRQVRSIWQNLRLCGIGCFALTIQCATCCQVARCVKDDNGIDDATPDSPPLDRVASETTPESRE
ncbi:hypothetical protein F1559_002593 [Cyanidiococcus yangmingshanensis]|uniref:PNPLA domain-containing protein n=1 Tax=Cyanidiococcus yangmingshanensis TaxID=2690220 RepID=A0A7J7IN46_9RHOD|nr:hypothetical protein F1559_002593 [Cyanidiococcus yangmingshanensis]